MLKELLRTFVARYLRLCALPLAAADAQESDVRNSTSPPLNSFELKLTKMSAIEAAICADMFNSEAYNFNLGADPFDSKNDWSR